MRLVGMAVLAGLLPACEPDTLYREPDPPAPEAMPAPSGERRSEPAIAEPELVIPVVAETEVPVVWCDEAQTVSVQVRPLDVVLIVDNSGSMGEEIASVQANINASLAVQLAASGVDYRVILLSLHGAIDTSDDAQVRSICISAPLSASDCDPVPAAPAVTDRFFHYSVEIGSRDAWCQVLLTLDGQVPDRHGLAPDGWQQHLRADSIKSFIVMTDDGVGCVDPNGGWLQDLDASASGQQAAEQFDRSLRSGFAGIFEEDAGRTYVWHSVVGMDPEIDPAGRIVEEIAPTASAAGIGHQALSLLTDGLRFPISDPSTFGELFRVIAEASVETTIDRTRCD
jgi:hypothetical protein